MLAFICPETQGSYRGFAYDAIAISYYNDAVLRLLDNSAFEGNASNYVIYPDGRVVIDNSVNRKETIYNFIAMLRDHSDLSEEQITELSNAFAQGSSGNLKVKLGDTSYYLVYEGTAVQSWTMVGLVPVSIVNASLDELWFHTVQIVAGIVAGLALLVILLIVRRSHVTLRRKNTEISYRDELFQKLSLNVDDVFLMLASDPTASLAQDKVQSLLSALCTYATAQTTDADLAACGFDAPVFTAVVTSEDGSTVQLAYACGTDGWYLQVEGEPSVYTVDTSTVQALLLTENDLKTQE